MDMTYEEYLKRKREAIDDVYNHFWDVTWEIPLHREPLEGIEPYLETNDAT